MALAITHPFVSAIPDDPAAVAAGEVVPSNWNAAHAISGGTPGSVLFIDGSNNLAQDNANFFWDDTNLVLKAGKILQQDINGTFHNALFPVYGGAIFANSWFVGQSGNTTLTGYNNTGVGFGPMIIASTGHDNTAVGTFALNVLTTSNFNTAVGVDALGELDFPGSTGGDFNSAFGVSSLHALEFGTGNTAVGNRAGNEIGRAIQSDNNTLVGMEVYRTSTSGSTNTVVGYRGGYNITSGSNNTLLGGWEGPSSTLSSVIALSDGAGSLFLDYNFTNTGKWTTVVPLAFNGSGSGTVSVTTQAAAGTWTMTLPTTAGTNGYVLQTDGTGITSWVTSGAASIAIGSTVTSGTAGSVLFVGAGPMLAQDNANFFWDDSLFNLHIGNAYFIGTSRAIFTIPNASGNNWFEGAAGNTTVTGFRNFGTGDAALAALTSGNENIAVGRIALTRALDASSNVSVGSGSMQFTQSDTNNVGIGFNALATLGISGAGGGGNTGNLAIGFGVLGNVSIASKNVVIGVNGLQNIQAPTTASQNTIIGSDAGGNLGSGGGASVDNNIFIGTNSGANLTGATIQNTWIGGYKGPSGTLGGRTMVLSDGGGFWLFDFHLTTAVTWSMNYAPGLGIPTGLHIYNFQDAVGPAMTVYERACMDWNLTTNVFRIASQATGGAHPVRLIAIDGFQKAGAPAAGDLPSGTFALINDTSGGQTWLAYNNSGTIRKVQLT